MFSRITISEVPASKVYRIAFSILKPDGWQMDNDQEWLSFGPLRKSGTGFGVIMATHGEKRPESLLPQRNGLVLYMRRLFPDMRILAWEEEEDDNCPYDLQCFHGRVAGVPGRVAAIGARIIIEDVNFALVGFANDEKFHTFRNVFRAMVSSFQPIVTGER